MKIVPLVYRKENEIIISTSTRCPFLYKQKRSQFCIFHRYEKIPLPIEVCTRGRFFFWQKILLFFVSPVTKFLVGGHPLFPLFVCDFCVTFKLCDVFTAHQTEPNLIRNILPPRNDLNDAVPIKAEQNVEKRKKFMEKKTKIYLLNQKIESFDEKLN